MERVFKPTDEMMAEFKPWNDQTEPCNTLWLRAVMTDIIVKCMSDCAEDNTQRLYKDFTGLLKMVGMCSRDAARYGVWHNYNDSDNGLVWLYTTTSYDQSELDRTIMDMAETLTVMAKTVQCDGYFGDNSNWFDFRDEIKGKLEYICEVFDEAEISEIASKLESAELHDDDFDEDGNLKVSDSGDGQDNSQEPQLPQSHD